MLYKIIVQEERSLNPDEETFFMKTIHEVASMDQVVIAKTLRAIADAYDPPRTQLRGSNPAGL